MQVAVWPGTPPDAQSAPGPQTDWSNIAQPTLTVYAPQRGNTGIAILVFPGGGFEGLAIKGEGTDICDWLTSKGITCVLLRYRVPSLPYDWHCKCRPDESMPLGCARPTFPSESGLRWWSSGCTRLAWNNPVFISGSLSGQFRNPCLCVNTGIHGSLVRLPCSGSGDI